MATSLGQEKALFAKCNVTQEQDIVSAIQSATQKWPNKSIGGVVCCGGLSDGALTIDHEGNPADLKPFEKLVQVNLIGSYNLSRLVASEMVRRGGGRGTEEKGSILLVSSTSYQDPQPGLAGYAASKGGVASLVLPLSQDLARFGIRVNAVAPSMFETAMMQGIAPRARKAIESRFVFPKRGERMSFLPSSAITRCAKLTANALLTLVILYSFCSWST